jgi:hypothetical protein
MCITVAPINRVASARLIAELCEALQNTADWRAPSVPEKSPLRELCGECVSATDGRIKTGDLNFPKLA